LTLGDWIAPAKPELARSTAEAPKITADVPRRIMFDEARMKEFLRIF
jgi:hypothetical protein